MIQIGSCPMHHGLLQRTCRFSPVSDVCGRTTRVWARKTGLRSAGKGLSLTFLGAFAKGDNAEVFESPGSLTGAALTDGAAWRLLIMSYFDTLMVPAGSPYEDQFQC